MPSRQIGEALEAVAVATSFIVLVGGTLLMGLARLVGRVRLRWLSAIWVMALTLPGAVIVGIIEQASIRTPDEGPTMRLLSFGIVSLINSFIFAYSIKHPDGRPIGFARGLAISALILLIAYAALFALLFLVWHALD